MRECQHVGGVCMVRFEHSLTDARSGIGGVASSLPTSLLVSLLLLSHGMNSSMNMLKLNLTHRCWIIVRRVSMWMSVSMSM